MPKQVPQQHQTLNQKRYSSTLIILEEFEYVVLGRWYGRERELEREEGKGKEGGEVDSLEQSVVQGLSLSVAL